MRLFYTILWWNADHDLTIALNTGRGPKSIKQLRAAESKWSAKLDRLSIQP